MIYEGIYSQVSVLYLPFSCVRFHLDRRFMMHRVWKSLSARWPWLLKQWFSLFMKIAHFHTHTHALNGTERNADLSWQKLQKVTAIYFATTAHFCAHRIFHGFVKFLFRFAAYRSAIFHAAQMCIISNECWCACLWSNGTAGDIQLLLYHITHTHTHSFLCRRWENALVCSFAWSLSSFVRLATEWTQKMQVVANVVCIRK